MSEGSLNAAAVAGRGEGKGSPRGPLKAARYLLAVNGRARAAARGHRPAQHRPLPGRAQAQADLGACAERASRVVGAVALRAPAAFGFCKWLLGPGAPSSLPPPAPPPRQRPRFRPGSLLVFWKELVVAQTPVHSCCAEPSPTLKQVPL